MNTPACRLPPCLSAGIAAGSYHTCALQSGGGAYCWGWNYFGQLGTGDTTDRYTPTAVTGLTGGCVHVSVSVNVHVNVNINVNIFETCLQR